MQRLMSLIRFATIFFPKIVTQMLKNKFIFIEQQFLHVYIFSSFAPKFFWQQELLIATKFNRFFKLSILQFIQRSLLQFLTNQITMQQGYQQQFRPPIQQPTNPNFHPAACNICGQLGHQAVNCSIGTIRWKDIYGEDAFIIRPPLYWSEIQEKRKRKKLDLQKLEHDAKEFAKQTAATLGLDYNQMIQDAIKSEEAKKQLEEMRREREAMGIIQEQYDDGDDDEMGQQQQVEAAQQQLAQMDPTGQLQMQQQFQQFAGVPQQQQGQFQYVQQQPGQQQQVQQPPQQILQQPPPAEALPEGWAEARDPQGRVYYWHRKTHKTQWDKPTKDSPIE
eukprot:TRINITY_DN8196_c1_g3_i1.p1 TRINITY_DN8196_c1_g3~~TRINITY_DN8196_c1_g3_i1.p1  ORF type:complete len:334 (+),score=32.07 TRINITY_DN8196_c1_g3_i1:149-1150(+)